MRVARLKQIAALAREGQAQWDAPVAALAQRPFNRIIYLGSGPLERWRECALKVLELTAGRVLALANTPLGFRHGPKSTLDGNTLVVVLRSVQPRAATNRTCWKSCAATAWPARCWRSARIRTSAPMTNTPHRAGTGRSVAGTGVAGLRAVVRAAALGRAGPDPDNPFPDGTVNRVVKGVTIHHG